MDKTTDKQEVTVMGVDTNIEAKEVENKEKQPTKHGATRAAIHTDTRFLFILIGLVATLTVGFCYLFGFILRIRELHHRNGERVTDLVRARLDEQQKQQQHHRNNY